MQITPLGTIQDNGESWLLDTRLDLSDSTDIWLQGELASLQLCSSGSVAAPGNNEATMLELCWHSTGPGAAPDNTDMAVPKLCGQITPSGTTQGTGER